MSTVRQEIKRCVGCTIDMHIRYSFVKQNYSDVLRLKGKTISNGKIEIGTVR